MGPAACGQNGWTNDRFGRDNHKSHQRRKGRTLCVRPFSRVRRSSPAPAHEAGRAVRRVQAPCRRQGLASGGIHFPRTKMKSGVPPRRMPWGRELRRGGSPSSWASNHTACIPLLSRPSWGGKVLASLAVALARQGLQGMSSHSRRAAAPSSSPAETERASHATEVF